MKTPSPQEAAKTVRELPILFAPDLAQKVYLGLKTETRRLVKRDIADCLEDGGNRMIETDDGLFPVTLFAPYHPGDLLYVRENWAYVESDEYLYQQIPQNVIYQGAPLPFEIHRVPTKFDGSVSWKPSIHMPKWAARTWLEVLSVSVEKVSEITREGARAEGYPVHDWNAKGVLHMEDRSLFREAWNARYPGTWEANAWVWVIKFKKVEAPNGRA